MTTPSALESGFGHEFELKVCLPPQAIIQGHVRLQGPWHMGAFRGFVAVLGIKSNSISVTIDRTNYDVMQMGEVSQVCILKTILVNKNDLLAIVLLAVD